MQVEIERSHWSVVLLGSFNPAIFHPSWLALHGIVSKEVASLAEIDITHNQVSEMTIGDIRVTVDTDRFQVDTNNAPEIRLKDFASKVFGDVLPHSKITGFGVNKSAHFRAVTSEKRTDLGRMLAPLEHWGEFGARIAKSEGDLVGGVSSMRLRETLNDDDSNGHLEARIEPSSTLDRRTGVFVAVNRHFGMKDLSEHDGAHPAMRKLDQEFENAINESDKIISHFAELVS